MVSKIEQTYGLSKIFHKSSYSNIPLTQVTFSLEMILIWFNCFLSWPHGGVHLSKHLNYFYIIHLNPGIVKSRRARWMKLGRYLRMLWMSFTIAVTHRYLLAPHLSDGLWLQRFTSSAVRTVLFHPPLLLSRFEYLVVSPWDKKKWLTLGILEWLPERNWLWELPFSRFP